MSETYVGIPHNITFRPEAGTVESDGYGVCLYGDPKHPAAALAGFGDRHQRDGAYEYFQAFNAWVRFSEYRHYDEVTTLFQQVANLFEQSGWEMIPALDGYPDSGSSIGDLKEDFSQPEGGPEGLNMAGGFEILLGKTEHEPGFTEEEVQQIIAVLHEVARLVFGQEFPQLKY